MKFLDIVSRKIFDFRLIENCNKMFIIFKLCVNLIFFGLYGGCFCDRIKRGIFKDLSKML